MIKYKNGELLIWSKLTNSYFYAQLEAPSDFVLYGYLE